MSWLDWSILADLSSDGRSILFNETREGGGRGSGIYLRKRRLRLRPCTSAKATATRSRPTANGSSRTTDRS